MASVQVLLAATVALSSAMLVLLMPLKAVNAAHATTTGNRVAGTGTGTGTQNVSRGGDDCSSFQELLLFYGDETTCGHYWYYWMDGTCYTESEIYFSAQGQTWATGFSAMFLANYNDPTQSTWTFFSDENCQSRVHGIDGFSCNRCSPNPSGWILSIGGYNVTGYQVVNQPVTDSA